MYMHVSAYTDMLYEYRWMSYDFRCLQGRKRTSDPLELESQVVVSYLIWMLGSELKSSERAVNIHNHWTISPVSSVYLFVNEATVLLWVESETVTNAVC